MEKGVFFNKESNFFLVKCLSNTIKEKVVQINNLFFFCLLFVSVFSTSCFSMQSGGEEKRSFEDGISSEERKDLNLRLIRAAQIGETNTVLYLLGQGADINYQEDYTGKTALHYAAGGDHSELVKLLLLRGGVDTKIKDACGNTVFHSVVNAQFKGALGYDVTRTKEIIQLLAGWPGYEVNATNKCRQTPYWWAAYYNIDVLKTFESLGAYTTKRHGIRCVPLTRIDEPATQSSDDDD